MDRQLLSDIKTVTGLAWKMRVRNRRSGSAIFLVPDCNLLQGVIFYGVLQQRDTFLLPALPWSPSYWRTTCTAFENHLWSLQLYFRMLRPCSRAFSPLDAWLLWRQAEAIRHSGQNPNAVRATESIHGQMLALPEAEMKYLLNATCWTFKCVWTGRLLA